MASRKPAALHQPVAAAPPPVATVEVPPAAGDTAVEAAVDALEATNESVNEDLASLPGNCENPHKIISEHARLDSGDSIDDDESTHPSQPSDDSRKVKKTAVQLLA